MKLAAYSPPDLQKFLNLLNQMEVEGLSVAQARNQVAAAMAAELADTAVPAAATRRSAGYGTCPDCSQPLWLCRASGQLYCKKCRYSRMV